MGQQLTEYYQLFQLGVEEGDEIDAIAAQVGVVHCHPCTIGGG